jgi:hypothetical protein
MFDEVLVLKLHKAWSAWFHDIVASVLAVTDTD